MSSGLFLFLKNLIRQRRREFRVKVKNKCTLRVEGDSVPRPGEIHDISIFGMALFAQNEDIEVGKKIEVEFIDIPSLPSPLIGKVVSHDTYYPPHKPHEFRFALSRYSIEFLEPLEPRFLKDWKKNLLMS